MGEVTKAYLCEASMECAGMESIDGKPSKIKVPTQHASRENKTKFVNETIGTFVDEYVFPEFDVEKVWRLQQEQKAQQKNNQAVPDMSMPVQSVPPPTAAAPVNARHPAVVQTPPASTQTESSSQHNTPQVPSLNAASQGLQMVSQPVTATPASPQVLSAPRQSVQSSIDTRNSVQSSLGLSSFAAITDPQNTFNEGDGVNTRQEAVICSWQNS